MRSVFAALAVAVAVLPAGCGLPKDPGSQATPSSVATTDPKTWVMSPDSFGPVTMETTWKQALAIGPYRAAPPPCSRVRLDSRGQTYADIPGTDGQEPAKPHLPSILFDDDTPRFIDPAPETVTERGIRRADSFSRLQITYGDDLIPGEDQTPNGGTFAVSGDRSHLLFVVMYGKVIGFFIAAGHVQQPEDVLTVAGALTKSDSVRPGRGTSC